MRLHPHTLRVYYGSLSGYEAASFYDLLSEEEKERAFGIIASADRNRFIVSRAWLRILLGSYLSEQPEHIQFEYSLNGKPYVKGRKDLQFSLAHTRGMVVIGLLRDDELGLDIEHLDRKIDTTKLSEFIFSPQEAIAFRSYEKGSRQEAFINCWTRKEAFVKAKGAGLSFPVKELEVSFAKDEKAKVLSTLWNEQEKEEWYLESFDLPGNYRAAVAVQGRVSSLELIAIKKFQVTCEL